MADNNTPRDGTLAKDTTTEIPIGQQGLFRNNDDKTQVPVDDLNPLQVTDVTLPLTAFNELSVAQVTPIVQYMAVYGFSSEKNEIFSAGDGAVTIKDRQFNATTGTSISAGAALLSKRRLTYKPGQGMVARFTSLFNSPQPGTIMTSGLISATDRLGFGYNIAGQFGIDYAHDGVIEIQKLTVTTPATGSENATITINGTPFTVPLTAGSVNHNAFEISESLNAQVSLYNFTSNQDIITARHDVAIPNGSFAFSSATAVAAWAQVSAGTLPDTSDFIPLADFNGGIDMSDFDPTKGNVFEISMQYLGFGSIRWKEENSTTGKLRIIHTLGYANNNIKPSVVNPSFRLGIFAANATGTIEEGDLSLSSAFGGIEGKSFQTEPPRSIDVEGTVTLVNRSIITMRNRIEFSGIANRVETFPLLLTIGTDANKPIIIEAIIGADQIGDQIFSYIDEANSITEISTDQNAVSGGRLKYSFILPAGGSDKFDLSKLRAITLPGETMTIATRLASGGATGAVLVGYSWVEDL